MCDGDVYFGDYEEEGFTTPLSYWDMTGGLFTVNEANNTKNVSCVPASFEDTDTNSCEIFNI